MSNLRIALPLAAALIAGSISIQAQSLTELAADLLGGEPRYVASSTRAAELEEKLRRNPEDMALRTDLLLYYAGAGARELGEEALRRRLLHSLWVVENHPEWGLAGSEAAILPVSAGSHYDQLRLAWERQIEARGTEPEVLLNAARFFCATSLPQAESLLNRALRLSPSFEAARVQLGSLYGRVLLNARAYQPALPAPGSEQLWRLLEERARSFLRTSEDPAALNAAAETILSEGEILHQSGGIDPGFDHEAEILWARAASLSNNPEAYQERLQALYHQRLSRERIVVSDAESSRQDVSSDNSLPQPAPGVRRLMVSAEQMQEHLRRIALPEYPAEARRHNLRGTVSFYALIGPDGSVRALQLMAGHPALRDAAREAAAQWRFDPLFPVFGQAEILTTISLRFP